MRLKPILFIIILFFSALIGYYLFELRRMPILKPDPREERYLSLELKKKGVMPALDMLREDKIEEAIIFLKDERLKNNIFARFYLGLVYFETGKEKEGLALISSALKEEPALYDKNYPDNMIKMLKIISDKIATKDELRDYRHIIDSKLKGGCG